MIKSRLSERILGFARNRAGLVCLAVAGKSMSACWSWCERLARGLVNPRERCPVCPVSPDDESRLMRELQVLLGRKLAHRQATQGVQSIPVRIKHYQYREQLGVDHMYACETTSVVYYPQCHMLVLDGMLMGVHRPWSLSVKNDPMMTRLFRLFATGTGRPLIEKRRRDDGTSIWLYLDLYEDGSNYRLKELGFWLTPWDLRGQGSAFIPSLVTELQRWVRRCMKRRRGQMVLDGLAQARAHGEENWLNALPLDLLERGVLGRL